MKARLNHRFRFRQIGLVLLVLALVVPWTTGSMAEAPHSVQPDDDSSQLVADDPVETLPDPLEDSEREHERNRERSTSSGPTDDSSSTGESSPVPGSLSQELITLSSDDLSFQSTGNGDPAEIFGMVGRDPWYEYGTNPDDHPNDVNRTFLENMISEMADIGVRWIRFEFRAETDRPEGPGPIDWAKHDWFINELLPKYDIEALALLGSGFVGDEDKDYEFQRINDSPDQLGRNDYTEAFINHVEQVVDRYGDNIAAFEILNEPNNNQILSWETDGAVEEVNPLIYGRLVIDSYEVIKEINPNSLVVAGAMLHHHRDGVDRHFEWLERVYRSREIRRYRDENEGDLPWDVVSIHPYFLTVDGVVQHMFELRTLQREHDDSSPVWLTEIGYQAEPPSWTSDSIMDPTPTEISQAEFLQQIYTRLPIETPFVERIFWFKYEDFGVGTYARWGIVRLRDSNFQYGPEATPWPRKTAFSVYQTLARPERVPTYPQSRPSDEGDRVRYYEATGQELRDPFLEYWEDHGGLSMFGYPKTRVFEVRGRKVQYFERARFEYWPEHIGTQWEVQLGLLGKYETRDQEFEREPAPDDDVDSDEWTYYPQTGQFLAGAFRDYWEDNGGLDIFGYPISPEFEEVNPTDGQTYVVQYFERARFEWHPELAGTDHEVQLGLLGNQVLALDGWRR